jgi:uncharacterized protein YcnI
MVLMTCPARTRLARTAVVLGLLALTALAGPPAHGHTEADLVAVGAGDEATLTLAPTHGCDGSPTVEVAIRAPVPDARAGEVAGWSATATDDGQGNTVLEWTGGSLPADQTGAFPVTFTAPDRVGELLLFPAVQVCADGTELAWIDGDPEASYPAPRLLVLAAGSAPATSIDDVPPDAPGRDQLVTVVDVDNPTATTAPATTTAPASTEPPGTSASEPSAPTTVASDASEPGDVGAGADDGDDEPPWLAIGIVGLIAGAGCTYLFGRGSWFGGDGP